MIYNNHYYLDCISKVEILKCERNLLLKKFDIYKTLVNYGVLTETQERHKVITDWYQKLLDITITLDESLITNYPKELENY